MDTDGSDTNLKSDFGLPAQTLQGLAAVPLKVFLHRERERKPLIIHVR